MTIDTAEVGERLAIAREIVGMSQDDLAFLMDRPRSRLANWEAGRGLPDAPAMLWLAEGFGFDLRWLYGGPLLGMTRDRVWAISRLWRERRAD